MVRENYSDQSINPILAQKPFTFNVDRFSSLSSDKISAQLLKINSPRIKKGNKKIFISKYTYHPKQDIIFETIVPKYCYNF